MCVCADPVVMIFVSGVDCGFLHVYNRMRELFDGTHLNVVVIVMYVVTRFMLSILIRYFTLYEAVV